MLESRSVPVFRLRQLHGIRCFSGESQPFDTAPRVYLTLTATRYVDAARCSPKKAPPIGYAATGFTNDEESFLALYRADPQRFRQLIAADESARDLVAIAHRKRQLDRFRRLLKDEGYFSKELAESGGRGEEHVWQRFFEDNPWIFGVALAGQLLTRWNSEKLEQVVTGASITRAGKRTDALLRTSGLVKSLVFAEIKTPKTPLLGREPRSGCWSSSTHLSEGIAQVQGTVHLAVDDIGERLHSTATDGTEIAGDYTYLLNPRSYLIIGQLDQFLGPDGGHHRGKIRSFELLRSKLKDPEVVTFDELLARAEWSVQP